MRFTIALLFVFSLSKISSRLSTKYCVEIRNNPIKNQKNQFVEIIDTIGENCQEVIEAHKAYEYTSEKDESLLIDKHYQCSEGDMVEYSPFVKEWNINGYYYYKI